MESNQYQENLKISGNLSSDCTIFINDVCNLFPNSFQKMLPYLEAHFRIAIYVDKDFEADKPNSKLRYNSMQDYARDMVNCLLESKLENIVSLSHSINSIFSFMAANEVPHLFNKMILISAFPNIGQSLKNQYCSSFQTDETDHLLSSLMQYNNQNKTKTSKVNNPQFNDLLATAFAKMSKDQALSILKLIITSDCRDYLHNIKFPTLILQSSADRFSTSEVNFFMHRNIPDSRVIKILAKGHIPQLIAPEEIIQAMEIFAYLPAC